MALNWKALLLHILGGVLEGLPPVLQPIVGASIAAVEDAVTPTQTTAGTALDSAQKNAMATKLVNIGAGIVNAQFPGAISAAQLAQVPSLISSAVDQTNAAHDAVQAVASAALDPATLATPAAPAKPVAVARAAAAPVARVAAATAAVAAVATTVAGHVKKFVPGTPAPAADGWFLTAGADANNAPYGVTFAGFSPQDHQGLDLMQPGSEKYAAFQYLVDNQASPDPGWAGPTADDLNARLGRVIFVASDTETLSYGDEFIHTAPLGHGMQPGTYNPSTYALEFFWGAQS